MIAQPARADDAATATSAVPLFELHEVGFSVDGKRLLGPLDVSFPDGGMTALIGRNGSGKSTLLKILARQERPTIGSVQLCGEPIETLGGREFARRVAFLPQTCPPVPGMLVEELVALGRYPWHGALGRFGEADRTAVAQALRQTGLDRYRGRDVESLSGGERQRAFIAMLIAQGSRCLLLDEPISALDVAHQVDVLSLLRSLSRDLSLGIVIVLHDVNLAARFCDRLAALRDGCLVAEGAPDAMLNPEQLEPIYGQRFEVLQTPSGRPLAFPI